MRYTRTRPKEGSVASGLPGFPYRTEIAGPTALRALDRALLNGVRQPQTHPLGNHTYLVLSAWLGEQGLVDLSIYRDVAKVDADVPIDVRLGACERYGTELAPICPPSPE